MAKCKQCPRRKTCRDECYGDNPCDFALALDRLSRKIDARDGIIQKQKIEIERARRNAVAPDARVFGDYTLTPVLNEDNGKLAWWISKKGFTTARYCFTAADEKEVEYQIKNGLSGYISLLDSTLQGADVTDRIDRLLMDLIWALPKDPYGGTYRFWTDGEEILCLEEEDCESVANLLEDVLDQHSTMVVKTGYYDPEEDARNGETNDHTGFYYIDFE